MSNHPRQDDVINIFQATGPIWVGINQRIGPFRSLTAQASESDQIIVSRDRLTDNVEVCAVASAKLGQEGRTVVTC